MGSAPPASSLTTTSAGSATWPSFFVGLERDWRGWPDVRSWESLEGELRIDARHEYGNVQLTIALRRGGAGWGNNGWEVTGDLTIEPGEQLSQVARDVTAMAAAE
jgi:hypothetical protein